MRWRSHAGLGTTEQLEEAGEESEAVEAVNMLLDHGADINAVNNEGETAMHGAAYNIYPPVVERIRKSGKTRTNSAARRYFLPKVMRAAFRAPTLRRSRP